MSTPESAEADANATTTGNGTPDPAGPERPAADGGPADASAAPEDTDGEIPGDAGGADSSDDAANAPESRADLLPSPIFLLLLGVTGLAGWLSWTRAELDWGGDEGTVYLPFVFILAGWIASIALHEFAHALFAYRFGDRALRGSGYLRLNPFRFRELFAGLLLPVSFPILGESE
ncbi:zinc metalloprotease [Allosalinactinospora lopnorensis]|uniref:hypothetical protein n=1 Tax=Allosalinactinospora lopnorensis TaxID=1352348 RepID=UPI0006965FF1|nr:hypothetical protein [Allosalinactinospora lopnorensis]